MAPTISSTPTRPVADIPHRDHRAAALLTTPHDPRASIYWGSPPGSLMGDNATRFGNLVIVLFLLAQATDGVFTYIGLTQHGLVGEGNPLLAWLMHALGTGPALAGAKFAAAGFGMILHLTAVHRIIFGLTIVYLLAAVLPWAVILFHGI